MIPLKNPSRLLSGVVTGALVTTALSFTAPAAHALEAASGAKVLLLNDGDFVDTAPLDVVSEDEDHEAPNMILALRAAGHQVTTLDESTPSTLASVLEGQDAFVVPELENGDWVGSLDDAARAAVASWVRAGGTLVVADDEGTLNGLFGYSIESRGWGTSANVAPAGSPFRGAAATLANNDATSFAAAESLPKGAVVQYAGVPGGDVERRAAAVDEELVNASVFTLAQGRGTIVSLGWDWWSATPAQAHGQDGGWNDVLDRSVQIRPAATPAAPPVAPSNVFTLPDRGTANLKNATVSLSLRLPGAGRVSAVSARPGVLKRVSKSVGASGRTTVKLAPSKKTLRKLKKQLKHRKVASTKVTVKVTYTPRGGKARTVAKTYTLKLKKAKKSKKR